MEWICFFLKEASTDSKNFVRRSKTKDKIAEYFGTRKFNTHGRYMSILSLKGMDRSVVILPEAFNADWIDIAFKIGNFINDPPQCNQKFPTEVLTLIIHMPRFLNIVNGSRKTIRKDSLKEGLQTLHVIMAEDYLEGSLLVRLVIPALRCQPSLDVRKWASSTWKKAFGINIYEIFLFKFPNRNIADQVLQGVWVWKKN